MRLTILAIGLVALGLAALAPVPATAEGPNVLQTFAVQVEPANRDAYLAKIKAIGPILERLGMPKLRVWQGSYAGDNTGLIIVAIEQSDLGAFAANSGKILNDAEFKKWQADLQKSGLSKLVGQSLWVDVTP